MHEPKAKAVGTTVLHWSTTTTSIGATEP